MGGEGVVAPTPPPPRTRAPPPLRLLGVADEGHTLPLMCKALGMEYAGRLHTGLDDSK